MLKGDSKQLGPVMCIVGARPNFMKIAPIIEAFNDKERCLSSYLVHTGQHYDDDMKSSFFDQLGIPEPDVDLGVGSGSHAVQTAEIMIRVEPVIDKINPSCLLVVGDVNSTIACALVAAKKGIPVVHVEAGLRSRDMTMPEEVNRILTDQLSNLLFLTEESARENLIKEGIDNNKIHFVGNVMIDTLLKNKEISVAPEDTLHKYFPGEKISDIGDYAVLTMHRPSNVDDEKVLKEIVDMLVKVSKRAAIIFAVHPRTKAALTSSGLYEILEGVPEIKLLPPLNYHEMLGMVSHAKFVLTDSGGLQEETTALGVPCITLRDNTERPITIEHGTNTLTGVDEEKILLVVDDIMTTGGKKGRVPDLWDGKAAPRIRDILSDWLSSK